MRPTRSVQLICPSGAVAGDAFKAGLEAFADLGFHGQFIDRVLEKHGYFAGSHQARAQRLRDVLRGSTDPIWMIRGGYGAIHTLEQGVPWFEDLAPRELWGFSDGTALLAAWTNQGWPAWYAPPLTQLPRLDTESRGRLQRAFFDRHIPPFEGLQTLTPGVATGPVKGGNLTVLASLVGTPFAANLEHAILLVEDVGEPAYKVDRLVTQLRLSGALTGVRGLVVGQFTDISDKEAEKIRAFFVETSEALNIPSAWGMPVGHGPTNCPVPMGEGTGFSATLTAGEVSSRLEFAPHG